MTNLTDQERLELLKPISAKYFTEEDAAALKKMKYDQPAMTAKWNALIEEAKSHMAASADPASAKVQDLARRWNGLIEQFTGGDDSMRQKIRAVWKEALADPNLAPIVPVTPEILAFMRKALEQLKSGK